MPFTFSHPAIVIGLSKSKLRLSLTALVAGSIVPDFEFFFRLKQTHNYAHHWPGVLVFDIPVAVFLCFLYHAYVKQTIILHLPKWFRSRFKEAVSFNWNKYVVENKTNVFTSLLIGIVSHLLWDAFTHDDGAFVLLISFLSSTVLLAGNAVPVYGILQVISSIWGLWIIYKEIAAMPVLGDIDIMGKSRNNYRIIFIIMGITILAIRLLLFPQYHSKPDLLIATIGSFIYAAIFTSIAFTSLNKIRLQEL